VLHAHSGIARSLDKIRQEGGELDLVELAQRLLSVQTPLERCLARRLLAAALECPAEVLPERMTATDLMAVRHGVLRESQSGARRSHLVTPLARTVFTVVDLETTGLSERCAIVEIGAVRVEALRVTARFETLVDPGEKVPAAIRDLTGIDVRALCGAPAPRAALSALRRWLAATPEAALVAHHAAFDTGFLRRGFDEHGLPPLRMPVLCTHRLGRRLLPRLRAYNLDALCAQFGISNHARHRALGDAEATARLLIELLALVRAQEAGATLFDLLELQDRPLRTRRSARRR
jgi:DNA polymerase III epsilon subunit family exonuclease